MLVDVSHLSDPGFWDVAEELSGPFLPAIPMPGRSFLIPGT